MEIDLDFDNFKEKTDSRFAQNSADWNHLYHLFCHEIGHGLQMGHDASTSSVMYSTIPQASRPQVDYEDYFLRARRFFMRDER